MDASAGDSGDYTGLRSGGAEDARIAVNIRCSNGTKFVVRAELSSTVAAFKAIAAEKCEIPADQQRLIYKGRILKDDQTLESYGLQADHTIHLVRGFAPSTPPNNSSSTVNSASNNSTQGAARGLGSADSGNLGGGLSFPGLGGLGGAAGSGLLGGMEYEQLQQQLMQNPSMMRDMMNLPFVQNFMNNPELIRQLLMSNPQMREIMDRNPDLAHILNDPSTLRQTLEAARNPELMREMMRNTDRAMSNIESSPEGFNMLRRMYETVQEPFLNATTMAADSGNETRSNPFAALLGNQGAGQTPTRDRTPNASTTGSESTADSAVPNTNPLPNPWNTAPNTATAATTPSSVASRFGSLNGLGGLGLSELERAAGILPDASSLDQMLQNPAMTQMMQSLLSNPQYVNQMLGGNPQMRNLLDSNSQLREMLQNPEFLRQLTSPETMQQMLSLQRTLLTQLNRPQTNPEGQNGGTTGMPNAMGMDLLMNMFGGLGAGGLDVNAPTAPPEELYATQLSQLQEMGFFDTQENIRALRATAGNVHAAVERLLGNPGP